jgi:5-methylcytosine-specific restriction endonuclease McrA
VNDQFRRTSSKAGWSHKRDRQPCRQCGGATTGRRRTFCSDECVEKWKVTTDPAFAAELVFRRDKGVCAICGVDCIAALAELKRIQLEEWAAVNPAFAFRDRRNLDYRMRDRERYPRFHAEADKLGMTERRRQNLDRRFWEADHTVPVVEGGGSCDLSNIRTVCSTCHRGETAKLRKRLSEARRQQADRISPPEPGPNDT